MAWPEHMAMQVFSSQEMQRLAIEKDDVIGEAGHGLHLAAHQQRVLVRDQQPAVERNLGPAARRHQRIVQRAAVIESDSGGVAQLRGRLGYGAERANLLAARAECAPGARAGRR